MRDVSNKVKLLVQQYLDQHKHAVAPDENGTPGYVSNGSYFSTLDNLPDFISNGLDYPVKVCDKGPSTGED